MVRQEVDLYSSRPGEAPLSSAFGQAWRAWLDFRRDLDGAEDSESDLVARVAEQAGGIVRRLWRGAFASAGDSPAQVKEMVYAFVALVDESLLFNPWPGQAAWQEKPLELRLYGSRKAGERIPRAIKTLLEERAPATRDLANVYLQCLILGFHGHLRGPRGQALHEKWRHALFDFAWQREPAMADVTELIGSPAAVEPVRLPSRRSLPDTLRLALAILGGAVLLTLVGHLFWRDIAGSLEPVLSTEQTLMPELKP